MPQDPFFSAAQFVTDHSLGLCHQGSEISRRSGRGHGGDDDPGQGRMQTGTVKAAPQDNSEQGVG
jgi:hypothetical protein